MKPGPSSKLWDMMQLVTACRPELLGAGRLFGTVLFASEPESDMREDDGSAAESQFNL